MKRAIALILVFCISVLFFVIPTTAEGEIFVAAGNTVLPLTDAMPIKSNGVWYIDYQCFSAGNLGISTSYNAAEGKLVLYSWDTTLIFDLNTSTAYIVHEDVQYKAVAVAAAGSVYIPAQFTSQIFGLEFSYDSAIPLIRIKRSSDIPNNMFQYIAKNAIPDLLNAYNKKKAEEKKNQQSSIPDSSPTETQQKSQMLRLSFNITSSENLGKILNSLSKYGFRATFFISPNAISDNGNDLRRAVTQGYSIGILAESISDLSAANQKLFDVAKTKTRLVRFKNSSSSLSADDVEKVIASGFRLWDSNIAPQGSASQIYSRTISQLKSSSRSPVLALSDSAASISALPRILSYLDTQNYGSYMISLLDTPVNQISERR